jgi:hypothetical protein
MTDYYTGVGSRKTPIEILNVMQDIGKIYAKKGYVLRSGGAIGADSAFEAGCDMAGGRKKIYIPWYGFNGYKPLDDKIVIATNLYNYNRAEEIARKIHLAYNKLTQGAKKLHTRNVYQVLGDQLNSPSKILFCWTEGGALKGGTATAIKLAKKTGQTKIVNLGDEEVLIKVLEFIKRFK